MTVRRVMPSRKQSGTGVWIDAVLDEEDVGAGGFGHLAAPVEHQRIGIALGSAACLESVQIM
jgi:hypothetical protein